MTISANNIVSINPGVVGGGGSPLSLNGVILSQNLLLPYGSVRPFVSPDAVAAFFGSGSTEYALAQTYFLGTDNSVIKPGTLWFAPYANAARAGWLQSGSFAGITLTQLKAITPGTMTVSVDGTPVTSSSINLSGATSFSNAATLIQAAFSGSVLTCAWNPVNSTFTLTSATTGATSAISFATGAISAALLFTAATGAIVSPGAAVDTPNSAMNNVKSVTQNWCSFATMWEPDTATKTLFAVWSNSQNQRYLYVAWDTDAQAIVANSSTAFGAIAKLAAYNGVMCVYNTAALAVFVLGLIACIDFNRTNGRTDPAFKAQSGFTPTVTDETIAANLLGNGYSFYGAYSTANATFNFLYDGNIPGTWKFMDSYVDQIYMNSQFQLAYMSLLTNVRSVPYNDAGYSLIRAACGGTIAQAINSGIIRTGVALSPSQQAQVNQAAGRDISSILAQQGNYLQVLDPGAQVRAVRGSPIINFWYTDGGSVHKISMASIAIL